CRKPSIRFLIIYCRSRRQKITEVLSSLRVSESALATGTTCARGCNLFACSDVPHAVLQAQHLPAEGISGEAIAGGYPPGWCSRKNLNSRTLQGNTFWVLPSSGPLVPFPARPADMKFSKWKRPHPPGE